MLFRLLNFQQRPFNVHVGREYRCFQAWIFFPSVFRPGYFSHLFSGLDIFPICFQAWIFFPSVFRPGYFSHLFSGLDIFPICFQAWIFFPCVFQPGYFSHLFSGLDIFPICFLAFFPYKLSVSIKIHFIK